MKIIRVMLLALIVGGLGCLISCGKETPADKIDNTTNALENKIEGLQKDVEEKKAEEATK